MFLLDHNISKWGVKPSKQVEKEYLNQLVFLESQHLLNEDNQKFRQHYWILQCSACKRVILSVPINKALVGYFEIEINKKWKRIYFVYEAELVAKELDFISYNPFCLEIRALFNEETRYNKTIIFNRSNCCNAAYKRSNLSFYIPSAFFAQPIDENKKWIDKYHISYEIENIR